MQHDMEAVIEYVELVMSSQKKENHRRNYVTIVPMALNPAVVLYCDSCPSSSTFSALGSKRKVMQTTFLLAGTSSI